MTPCLARRAVPRPRRTTRRPRNGRSDGSGISRVGLRESLYRVCDQTRIRSQLRDFCNTEVSYETDQLADLGRRAIRLRFNLPISMPTPTPSLLSVPSLPTPGRPTSPSPEGGAHVNLPKHGGVVPSGKAPLTSTTSTTSTKKAAERIEFDPLMVAKRTEGWEDMLAGVLVRWVEEAAREEREREVGEVGASDSQPERGNAVASQSQDSQVIEEATDGEGLA